MKSFLRSHLLPFLILFMTFAASAQNEQLPFPKITYHTFAQVQSMLKSLERQRPDIIKYFEYGISRQGHMLMGVKISDHVLINENEPELLLTAATHGDESITTEMLLGLIDRLQTGYGVDARLTAMVDNHEIFFIPVINPDGFIQNFRNEDGLDPNRSYPDPENPATHPTPSIAGVIDLFKKQDFKGSIDFHAGSPTQMIMYPWAYTLTDVELPYLNEFYSLASDMAATNGFAYGPISHLIHEVSGSSADFYFWQKQTIALGIELGPERYPQIAEIENYTDQQMESTWRFIEHF